MESNDTTSESGAVYLRQEDDEDPQDMTYSRRAARYLSRYRWYYPRRGKEKQGGPCLDAAWSHYEHVTLARCYERNYYLNRFHVVTTEAASKSTADGGDDAPADVLPPSSSTDYDYVRASKSAGCDPDDPASTRLYPVLKTPLKELMHFGVSTRMYFTTLLVFSCIMFVAGLFNIPMMAYFLSYAGDQGKDGVDYMGAQSIRWSAICDASEWVNCETCNNQEYQSEYPEYRLDGDNQLVLKNDCDFDHWLAPGIGSFVATAVLLTLMSIFFWKQRRAEIVLDEAIQTASDYSIKIANPPSDATNPEEWRHFFSRFASGPGKGVVLVTIALDNAELLRALVTRRQKLHALELLLPDNSISILDQLHLDPMGVVSLVEATERSWTSKLPGMTSAQQLWKDVQQMEGTIRTLAQRDYSPVAVFVTFEDERSQRNALHALSTGKMHVWRNSLDRSKMERGLQIRVVESIHSSSMWDFSERQEEKVISLRSSSIDDDSVVAQRKTLAFRSHHVLHVKEAPEPSDIRWLDLQASNQQRLELYVGSIVGIMVFVMISGFVIFRLFKNYPVHYATIFITLTNTVVPMVCELINDFESHPTEHGKQTSLYVKISIFRWFNSAIALSLISSFVESISVENDKEYMQESLLYKVYPVIVAELLCTPFIELMDLPENFRKHFLAPRAKTQTEMNACFKGRRFWLAERYTDINRVMFVALFFSSILPESFFLASMAMFAQFFVGKFSLMRLCGTTADLGFHLSRLSRNYFIPFILLAHVIMSAYWWSGYPYDNVCEQDEDYGGGYTYCNQNFFAAGVFPPLPRFQSDEARWMSESQETITSLFGWTSVVALSVAFLAFVRNNAVPAIKGIYESTYEPDGMDQGVDLSEVKHREEIQGYIPQVVVPQFAFPLLACDFQSIDSDLINWKDPINGFEPHNLMRDVEWITDGSPGSSHPVFSIVHQWNTTKKPATTVTVDEDVDEDSDELLVRPDTGATLQGEDLHQNHGGETYNGLTPN